MREKGTAICRVKKEYKVRKLIASVFITLDGFMEGPNGELAWQTGNENTENGANEEKDIDNLLSTVDAILLGRRSYDNLVNYWPSASGDSLADKMNTIPKFVFSNTLKKVDWGKWNNATLVKGNIVDEI